MSNSRPKLSRFVRRAGTLAQVSMAVLLAAGCASSKPPKPAPVFFPPPPALPRIQYLTQFSGLRDVESQSGFNRFVAGAKHNLQLDKPYGVAIWRGKIFVCDTNSTVVVLDLEKKRFRALTGAVGAGALVQPLNVSVEPDGTLYVADPVRGQVVVFDRDEKYLRAFGKPDEWKPVDAVPFGDRLYVADNANGLVKVLDKTSGELLKSIGAGGPPAERLSRPTNLAFDRDGYLYVTDLGRFQIVKFDRDGHFKSTFGAPGDTMGHFARPKGISLDREGRLFVVDAAFSNVQIFASEGYLLSFFGEGKNQPGGLQLPAKIAVDYDNVALFRDYAAPEFEVEYLLLITNQFGPRKVSVFGVGKEKGKAYPSDTELRRAIEEQRKQEQPSAPPPPARN